MRRFAQECVLLDSTLLRSLVWVDTASWEVREVRRPVKMDQIAIEPALPSSSSSSSSSSSYMHGKWLEEALGAPAGEEEAWTTTAAEAAGLSTQQVLYRGSDAGWFVSSAAAAAVQEASGVLASASAALHPFEVAAWQQRVGENTYADAPSVYVVALGSEAVSTLVRSIHAQRTDRTMAAADSAIVASRAATESAFESAKCVRTILFVDCILYPICVSLTT